NERTDDDGGGGGAAPHTRVSGAARIPSSSSRRFCAGRLFIPLLFLSLSLPLPLYFSTSLLSTSLPLACVFPSLACLSDRLLASLLPLPLPHFFLFLFFCPSIT
ncbi:hypothetical protein FB451DRAFT_1245809, partial [Mycena latifolia]